MQHPAVPRRQHPRTTAGASGPCPAVRRSRRSPEPGALARRLIEGVVAADPGIHVARLAVLTGLGWGACEHHVARLRRSRRVLAVRVQGRVCLYPGDRRTPQKAARALLRDALNRRVACLVLHAPGLSQREISERLGLATSVVHRRIHALEAAGAVLCRRDGRVVRCTASPALEDLLPSPRSAFPAALWSARPVPGGDA